MISLAKRLFALFALIVLVTLPVACGSQSERVLIRVEGQPITEADLEHELIVQDGARQLLEMIDTKLIEQAATSQKINISDGDVDLKYQQAAARIGSERDLEDQLKKSRRTKLEFREELRAEAMLDHLAEARNPVDEADVRRYYDNHKPEFSHGEQVRMKLMLFANRQNADTVADALMDPQSDFAGLAKAFSEDPATKDNGGDTGFVQRSDYAKPISDLAFSLPPGKVSGVFAVPDGFAIIRVEEKRPAGVQPYEQVKESVHARVAMEQLEQSRRDWLKAARAKAEIQIPDSFLADHVKVLIEAEKPFEPSNLAPEIPMAPR